MILVTGASGLLGSEVCNILAQKKVSYFPVTRNECNLLDFNQTLSLIKDVKPTYVIHAAAKVHGLLGNTKFIVDMYDQNMLINHHVIRSCYESGVHKVFLASTVAGYPVDQFVNAREDKYLSGEPHLGEYNYAHAKRAMLIQAKAYKQEYSLDFAYGIFTNLYGPNDRFDVVNGHVIPSLVYKFIQAQKQHIPVTVWGTGKAKRDFLFVSDAASACIDLLINHSGVFNIASGTTVPIASVVDALIDISGYKNIVWDSSMPDGQLDRSYNIDKLKSTGFNPVYSLYDGLKLTYDWCLNNVDALRN